MKRFEEMLTALCIGIPVGTYLLKTDRVLKAIQLFKECLIFFNVQAGPFYWFLVRMVHKILYELLFIAYYLAEDLNNAKQIARKLQILLRESSESWKGGWISLQLGVLYYRRRNYKKAKELYMEALRIMVETGETKLQVYCLIGIGVVLNSFGEFVKAKQHLEKAVMIAREIGDVEGERMCYTPLGDTFHHLGEYNKAIEYYERTISCKKEIGDESHLAACHGRIATVLDSLQEFGKARHYFEKSLVIAKETGDKENIVECLACLGDVSCSNGEYDKAEEYYEETLKYENDKRDKKYRAGIYTLLGNGFKSLKKFTKAKEYYGKAIQILEGTGDRTGEVIDYAMLGQVFESLGDHVKAMGCYQKGISFSEEAGNRKEEEKNLKGIGFLFLNLGEYTKAKEFIEKALEINSAIGRRRGEASCYEVLGRVFGLLRDHDKERECYENALALRREMGDRNGEATDYILLGLAFIHVGDFLKGKVYFQKARLLRKETGNGVKEAIVYYHLANVSHNLGEYTEAEEYLKTSLLMSEKTGDILMEAKTHAYWSLFEFVKCNFHEVESHISANLYKRQEMLTLLGDNDLLKMSFLDELVGLHRFFSAFFQLLGLHVKALHAEELERARALVDLMSSKYSVVNQISADPQTFVGIQNIMKNEQNCTCLYISYWRQWILLWILEGDKPIRSREISVKTCLDSKFSSKTVHEVLGSKTWRKFQVVAEEKCEDRSWFSPLNANKAECKPSQGDVHAFSRLVEEEEDEDKQPLPTLADGYNMFFAPVAYLLEKTELIVVPDRLLFSVPFAALKDENEKHLSERFRIRLVPSLTTLKLIQDSPADYHSQTGALIVGNPDVGEVLYEGFLRKVSRLRFATEEAEMIGKLIGTEPLLGKKATKQAVLERIRSVSLVHFAAHGDAERGEIVLAPPPAINRTPEEEDYLLTMADISQVRLRAKLAVLSCCHSAKGQIRAEGVVGIARAFLGSGARSVMVALWAIEDEATKQLMSRFYEHLVRGESASESLHQAMKWMRENGYSKVGQWAPFTLIGDNVTFDFRAKGVIDINHLSSFLSK